MPAIVDYQWRNLITVRAIYFWLVLITIASRNYHDYNLRHLIIVGAI